MFVCSAYIGKAFSLYKVGRRFSKRTPKDAGLPRSETLGTWCTIIGFEFRAKQNHLNALISIHIERGRADCRDAPNRHVLGGEPLWEPRTSLAHSWGKVSLARAGMEAGNELVLRGVFETGKVLRPVGSIVTIGRDEASSIVRVCGRVRLDLPDPIVPGCLGRPTRHECATNCCGCTCTLPYRCAALRGSNTSRVP